MSSRKITLFLYFFFPFVLKHQNCDIAIENQTKPKYNTNLQWNFIFKLLLQIRSSSKIMCYCTQTFELHVLLSIAIYYSLTTDYFCKDLHLN